jgi:hypothetical protein
MIGVAISDWRIEYLTSQSIKAIASRCACEVVDHAMFNDGVARARNNLAWDFLQSDCTHLFFLDSDIIIEPWQFDRLLAGCVAGRRVVGGMYPKKQAEIAWVWNRISNDEMPDEQGYIRAKHLGNGCMLIARAELESQIAKHPEILYHGDPGPDCTRYDFFPMRAVNGAYLSEDWAFCDRIIADGGQMWMDTKVQLRHIGKIIYPLQFTLGDDDVADLLFWRYRIPVDHIRTFIASGQVKPGMWGGQRHHQVRHWPADFAGVPDLHDGEIIAGAYDVPLEEILTERKCTVVDLGAGIGAFARWVRKRWPFAALHCYEADPAAFGLLRRTLEKLPAAEPTATVAASDLAVGPVEAAELPACDLLKIDRPGQECAIVESLKVAGRLDALPAIVIRYHADRDVFFLHAALNPTHYLHCHQRFYGDAEHTEGEGVLKYLCRKNPEVPAAAVPVAA